MKQWREKHLCIPWISLWLILMGMHAAICSALIGKIYIQEVWLLYGISAVLILVLVILPRRFMIAGLTATGLGIVAYCWRSAERLISDLYVLIYYVNKRSQAYIGRSLIKKSRTYMGKRLIVENWSQKGMVADNRVLVLLCILLGIFIAFSLLRYFNRFYGVLPVFLIYCGGLMFGKAPGNSATILLLAGMAVAFMWASESQGSLSLAEHEKISAYDWAKRYVLTALMIGIGLSVAWYATEHFQEKVFKNVDKIQRNQHKMELALQKKSGDLLQHICGVLGVDGGGGLTNSSPYYTDSVVMRVTVQEQPSQNVYLRGFVGDIYHTGRWKASDQIKDLAETGKFGKKAAWKGKYLDSYSLYGDLSQGDMEIQYKKKMTYRYQPYQPTQTEELTEQELDICEGGQDDELKLYEALARTIKEMDSMRSYDGIDTDISGVQWILQKNAEYSLHLDPLPYDQDYAEYFLFVSGKGYCEHFATAGTLLLRHLGISARYATGYCITVDQFVKNQDGTYTAEVLDSDAHAWCEVPIDGRWLPQEMTPGTRGESTYRETDNGETDIESFQSTGEIAEYVRSTPKNTPANAAEEEEESKAETPKPTSAAAPEVTDGNPLGNHSAGGNGGSKGGIVSRYRTLPMAVQILLAIPALCIPVAGIVVVTLRRKKRKREFRLKRMRQKSPKKYVGMRLALFLERMKRAGLPIHMEMSEKEWLQVLQEHYKEQLSSEEQNSLLELARRAAFSGERVLEEEIYWLDRLCSKLETLATDTAS